MLHGTRIVPAAGRGGQTIESHSISAGLDYPGLGRSTRGCTTLAVPPTPRSPTPRRWRPARLCRTEGILPAIESAHALAGALQLSQELGPEGVILVNLSGRGDKDADRRGLVRAGPRGELMSSLTETFAAARARTGPCSSAICRPDIRPGPKPSR